MSEETSAAPSYAELKHAGTVEDYIQQETLNLYRDGDLDPKEKLAALKQMVQVEQKAKQIRAEENGNESVKDLAAAIMTNIINRDDSPVIIEAEVIEREVSLDEELPEFELVEGETSTEMSTMDYQQMFGAEEE